jgi:hypothetical protein
MRAFWVVDRDSLKMGGSGLFGPFPSRAAAENEIRRDFAECWEHSDTPLADRDESYSGSYLVLEQVAEVYPVGVNSLRVKLEVVK